MSDRTVRAGDVALQSELQDLRNRVRSLERRTRWSTTVRFLQGAAAGTAWTLPTIQTGGTIILEFTLPRGRWAIFAACQFDMGDPTGNETFQLFLEGDNDLSPVPFQIAASTAKLGSAAAATAQQLPLTLTTTLNETVTTTLWLRADAWDPGSARSVTFGQPTLIALPF